MYIQAAAYCVDHRSTWLRSGPQPCSGSQAAERARRQRCTAAMSCLWFRSSMHADASASWKHRVP
jgi:hypothetical protein